MDIRSELPKLTAEQIAYILKTQFADSPVIGEGDAQSIYDAQVSSGISALAILGIAAKQSNWGTSATAVDKNNPWGYGGDYDSAYTYDKGAAAEQFAEDLLHDYYNGYELPTIYAISSGDGNGDIAYSQIEDGVADLSWGHDVTENMSEMVRNLLDAGFNDPDAGGMIVTDVTDALSANTDALNSNTGATDANTDAAETEEKSISDRIVELTKTPSSYSKDFLDKYMNYVQQRKEMLYVANEARKYGELPEAKGIENSLMLRDLEETYAMQLNLYTESVKNISSNTKSLRLCIMKPWGTELAKILYLRLLPL